MARFARARLAGLAVLLCAAPAGAGDSAPLAAMPEAARATDTLAPVMRELLAAIETLADYRAPDEVPEIYLLPQAQLEALVCEAPCNVFAAYLPGQGVVLSAHLDPVRELRDRAALLHELVHALQQGHARFAELAPCERERAKEREAYALQNAYLANAGSTHRVTFYEGEFECEDDAPALGPQSASGQGAGGGIRRRSHAISS